MRSTVSVSLAVLLLAAAGLPVVGFNPTDDDAGSGGDAGDHQDAALTIDPGNYTGRLTSTIDRRDFYSFQAQRGQVLTYRLDPPPSSGTYNDIELRVHGPDGTVYDHSFGQETKPLLVTENGTWAIQVRYFGNSGYLGLPVEYGFGIHLRHPQDYVILDGEAPVEVAEVRIEETAFLAASAWTTGQANVTDAAARLGAVQRDRSTGMVIAGLFGTGSEIEVDPSPVPDQKLHQSAELEEGGFARYLTLGGVEGEDTLRLVASRTGPTGSIQAWAYADANLTVRRVQSGEVVKWTDASAEGPKVVAPGLALGTPTQRTVNVTGHMFGFFVPWTTEGTITDPDGETTHLDCRSNLSCGERLFWGSPQEGPWRFGLEARAQAGWADRVYLLAALVPNLGLRPR